MEKLENVKFYLKNRNLSNIPRGLATLHPGPLEKEQFF